MPTSIMDLPGPTPSPFSSARCAARVSPISRHTGRRSPRTRKVQMAIGDFLYGAQRRNVAPTPSAGQPKGPGRGPRTTRYYQARGAALQYAARPPIEDTASTGFALRRRPHPLNRYVRSAYRFHNFLVIFSADGPEHTRVARLPLHIRVWFAIGRRQRVGHDAASGLQPPAHAGRTFRCRVAHAWSASSVHACGRVPR